MCIFINEYQQHLNRKPGRFLFFKRKVNNFDLCEILRKAIPCLDPARLILKRNVSVLKLLSTILSHALLLIK